MFDKSQPLGLPAGSVRSILALAVVAAYIANLVPMEMAALVLGFYFGVRQDGASGGSGE